MGKHPSSTSSPGNGFGFFWRLGVLLLVIIAFIICSTEALGNNSWIAILLSIIGSFLQWLFPLSHTSPQVLHLKGVGRFLSRYWLAIISTIIVVIIGMLTIINFNIWTSISKSSQRGEPTVSTSTAPPQASQMSSTGKIIFDFEKDAKGWSASPAGTVELTDSPVFSGHHALQITTTLSANQSRTDTIVDLNGNPGFTSPGPYDLSGKQLSCQVYLPAGLSARADPRAQIKLFVQSQQGGLNLGTPTIIKDDLINRWITVSLSVGANPQDTTYSFDKTQITRMGIRLELRNGSLLTYTGPFFVDDCSVM